MIARLHLLLTSLLLGFAAMLHAQPATAPQPRSDNGWYISPRGRIHILVVYAEMKFDSSWAHLDPVKDPAGTIGWKVGKLPNWKQWAVSMAPEENGWMTKYFRQASFGQLQVTGDVLDSIITIPISAVRDAKGNVVTAEAYAGNHYRSTVVQRMNAIQQPRFLFGSRLSDFDRWTFAGNGQQGKEEPNGKIDLVMVIWRNIHVVGLGEMSGFVNPGDIGVLWGMHSDIYSMFKTESMLPMVVMRHEFSHMLYGGNNFHTANGGVGQRTFMSTVGGWSNMSASDCCSPTWNGWDRERLGWQNPENQYLLSARCADTGEEQNGDLAYGQALCGGGEYILRDFATTGDVIKITLPHLPGTVRKQYLWLENHQAREGIIDHDKALTKGLYAYVQVGKDEREGKAMFGGACNYLWPLVSQGSYDFGYDAQSKGLLLTQARANALTGYTYYARHMLDLDRDHKLRVTSDLSPKSEYVLPEKLFVEGKEVPAEFFSYIQYPQFGTKETAFRADLHPKIGIAHNPAGTPVYSHTGPKPLPDDNRRIYLNGLSVEVLEQRDNGDLRIRIRWDDFDVPTHVRWCGDIVLKEQVIVNRGGSVTLDQGYSPQVTEAVQQLDGQDVFAEPTIMEVEAGALLKLDRFASLWVKAGSTLLVRKGARVELANQAGITVERGAHVYIEEGAQVKVARRSPGIVWVDGTNANSVHPRFAGRVR